jgi:hypothetical protein
MEESTQKTEPAKNILTMPVAVIIAGALIAGAVIYSGGKAPAAGTANQPQQPVAQQTKESM